ncbi:unnamed protein product [Lampetra planeri]
MWACLARPALLLARRRHAYGLELRLHGNGAPLNFHRLGDHGPQRPHADEGHDEGVPAEQRLLAAVEARDYERTAALLARKAASPTKLDSEGRSAFHMAAARGYEECLDVILFHGVDIMATDAAGQTAVHLSAKYGQPQCIKKLIQEGDTALAMAARFGQAEVCRFLLQQGAEVNGGDNLNRSRRSALGRSASPHAALRRGPRADGTSCITIKTP